MRNPGWYGWAEDPANPGLWLINLRGRIYGLRKDAPWWLPWANAWALYTCREKGGYVIRLEPMPATLLAQHMNAITDRARDLGGGVWREVNHWRKVLLEEYPLRLP